MINELYALSGALRHSNVETQSWHPKYRAIPNITNKNPCVRITLEDGNVRRISKVDPSFQPILRKYGSNQGSYPCMNLAPLYRITDEAVKKALSAVKPEELDGAKLETLRSWCTENNWTGKFQKKYRLSMDKMAAELRWYNKARHSWNRLSYMRNWNGRCGGCWSDGNRYPWRLLFFFTRGKRRKRRRMIMENCLLP